MAASNQNCRLLLGLPAPQQTSLPVVNRRNIRASPARIFLQPIAVESHGAFSASALSFLTTLGERLTGTSGDLREMSYLFQRLWSLHSVSIIGGDLVQVGFFLGGVGALAPKKFLLSPKNATMGDGGRLTVTWN